MLGCNEQNKQLNKIFYKFEPNGHCYSHIYKYIHCKDHNIDWYMCPNTSFTHIHWPQNKAAIEG